MYHSLRSIHLSRYFRSACVVYPISTRQYHRRESKRDKHSGEVPTARKAAKSLRNMISDTRQNARRLEMPYTEPTPPQCSRACGTSTPQTARHMDRDHEIVRNSDNSDREHGTV